MINNLFASDLDRTLIYSHKAILQLESTTKQSATVVEYKDNQALSVMSENALNLLQEIQKRLLFVPITTRTLQQFARIKFPFDHRYAVVANGAQILFKGKRLMNWEEYIQREVHEKSATKEELLHHIAPFDINGRLRDADGWFFYYVLVDPVPDHHLEELRFTAESHGWRISLQGRKLYFMPNAISKGRALQYIVEAEEAKYLYGAGDSLLDEDFLRLCDESFVPLHGELAQHLTASSDWLTKETGMMATEEFLEEILHQVTNPEILLSGKSGLEQKTR